MIPHVNVNGCVFCGALERGHSLRYDHLHPTGRNGYLAPPDEIRKARLKWLIAEKMKQHAAVIKRLENE